MLNKFKTINVVQDTKQKYSLQIRNTKQALNPPTYNYVIYQHLSSKPNVEINMER
jgi:hypothetical protein